MGANIKIILPTAVLLILCISSTTQTKPSAGAASLPSFASTISAEDLVRLCRPVMNATPENTLPLDQTNAAGFCMGYVTGVSDAVSYAENGGTFSQNLCIPKGVSSSQIARIVVKYGNDHPERLHLHATVFTIEALQGAFPCR